MDSLSIPPVLAQLSALLDEKPESLALGDADISQAALAASKYIFDLALQTEMASAKHIVPLIQSLDASEAPVTRSQSARSASGTAGRQQAQWNWKPTELNTLHVDGLHSIQVWAQLELRTKNICDWLGKLVSETDDSAGTLNGRGADGANPSDEEEDGSDELDDDDDDDEQDEEGEGDEVDNFRGLDGFERARMAGGHRSTDEEDEDEEESGDEDLGEDTVDLRDPDHEKDGDLHSQADRGPVSVLDDGFFNLAEFNAQTEAAESRIRSSGRLGSRRSIDADEAESEESEESDVDLFAPVEDAEVFDEEDLENSGEPYYKDFFDPPRKAAMKPQKTQAKTAKKSKQTVGFNNEEAAEPTPIRARKVQFHDKVRVKNIKPSKLRRQLSLLDLLLTGNEIDLSDSDESEEDGDGEDGEEDGSGDEDEDEDEDEEDEDMAMSIDEDEDDGHDSADELAESREAMGRVQDDLFADDDDDDDADLSAYDKRIEALQEQIKALEAENVAVKPWNAIGEVGARGRPVNSLLEEDLIFDRVQRVVPAVTTESVNALEELIKLRVLEARFDDVVRRKAEESRDFKASRSFELDDRKSSRSLAQLYEDEYTAANEARANGSAPVDDRDGRLSEEHKAIEREWEAISYRLDALCNAHFTPKAPKGTIKTLTDVATTSLESALPTTARVGTVLAPQEVLAPATRDDIRAKSEMTTQEKRAQRLRVKKAKRKARDQLERDIGKTAPTAGRKGGVKAEKERALQSVVKSGKGVTVVGKGKDATKGGKHSKAKS